MQLRYLSPSFYNLVLLNQPFKKKWCVNSSHYLFTHLQIEVSLSKHTHISSSSPAVPSSLLTWMPFISVMPCRSHPLSLSPSFSLPHLLSPSSTTHPLSKHPRGQNKEKELLSSFLITIQPFHCRQATLSLSASQSQRWKERERERESGWASEDRRGGNYDRPGERAGGIEVEWHNFGACLRLLNSPGYAAHSERLPQPRDGVLANGEIMLLDASLELLKSE